MLMYSDSHNTTLKKKLRTSNIKLSMEIKPKKREELILLIQKKTAIFKYKLKTFYLAVSIFDMVVYKESIFQINPEAFELIALVSLLLAVKFDEDDANIPDLSDFGFVNYKSFYTVDEIRRCEVICLQILDYNLRIYTPFSYVYHLCLNGIIFSDECTFDEANNIILECSLPPKANMDKITSLEKLYKLCFDILEVVILSHNYMTFTPFKLACCIVGLARECYGFKMWTERMEKIYNVSLENDLKTCFEFVKSIFLSKPDIERINTTPVTKDEKKKILSAKETKVDIKMKIQESKNCSNRNVKHIQLNPTSKNTIDSLNYRGSFVKNVKNSKNKHN